MDKKKGWREATLNFIGYRGYKLFPFFVCDAAYAETAGNDVSTIGTSVTCYYSTAIIVFPGKSEAHISSGRT